MYLQLAEEPSYLSRRKGGNRHPVKKVLLAPGRAFFLALLDYNIDGLASRLATENLTGLSHQWEKIGGDQQKLIKFINAGKKKQPRRLGFLDKFKGSQLSEDVPTDENPAGLTSQQKARVLTATTGLSTAIAAAIPATAPIALPAGPALGAVIIAVMPFIKNAANKTAADESAGSNTPPTPEPPPSQEPDGAEDTGGDFWKKYKTPILIGGGLIAIGAAYYFMKPKRR